MVLEKNTINIIPNRPGKLKARSRKSGLTVSLIQTDSWGDNVVFQSRDIRCNKTANGAPRALDTTCEHPFCHGNKSIRPDVDNFGEVRTSSLNLDHAIAYNSLSRAVGTG